MVNKREKIKVMVIVVLLLLAGGVYWYFNKTPELWIEEGYKEIEFKHVEDGKAICYNLSIGATTYVNNKSMLKLSILKVKMDRGGGTEDAIISILVEGAFSEDTLPNILKITAQSMNSTRNQQDFRTSSQRESGLKKWPPEKLPTGTIGKNPAWVGYDVKNREFKASIDLIWTVFGTENYTLRLTVEVMIGSTVVPVIIDVHLNGGDEK